MKRLRNYFISGLLFWIPLGLSILVIQLFITTLDNIIPARYQVESLFGFNTNIPGFGVILVLLITFVTGVLVSNFIGQKLFKIWEAFLNKIPGFRNIYNVLKQLSDTVLSPSSDSFKQAVLVQYPRKGMWTIAFKTGNYQGELKEKIGKEIVNIYMPTTPNPTSGFFIVLPKNEVIEMDMSVDDAFKLIISAGVVTPNQ